MTRTRFLTVSTAAILVLGLAACGGGSGDDETSGGAAQSSEPLKVATEGTYKPFTFHEEGSNELTGYDVEVVEAVAAKLGRKVEFSETSWDSIFAGLEAKRYDVIANQVSINPEREAKYSFSAPLACGAMLAGAKPTLVSALSITADVWHPIRRLPHVQPGCAHQSLQYRDEHVLQVPRSVGTG